MQGIRSTARGQGGFQELCSANSVPSEIGLCLFRVLQEALHNAAKYSGVKHVTVLLREESCAIHLNVSDSGRGFDIEVATQGRGLGLTSMHERVRLVNGTIEINSKPMSGTSIHVRVPLPSDQDSQRGGGLESDIAGFPRQLLYRGPGQTRGGGDD